MISIIIPAHNEKANLERLLPELVALPMQVLLDIIVVLSSENTDGTEKIEGQEKVRIIKCAGKGRAIQMNAGAASAMGDVLVFLHADVRPPKSFLHDIRTALQKGFDAGFFSYRFDNKSLWLKINASFTSRDGIFTGGGDQCLFIQKQLFTDLGKFDENQVLMEDFEFFQRMKRNRVKYKIIKNDLIVSARKYKNNSYLRVNLSNLLLVLLFKLGYPADKLKSLHNRLLKLPYQSNT
ncbi:MAG: glycosyltransferase family 2 protein [Pricia sp.]|nr:glycosyltransferase family 2 protein [Pricia sp.]